MFGSSARVVSVEEEEGKKGAYSVQAWSRAGSPSGGSASDAPPDAFVQRIEHPGGDVVVSPILEALRAWLRKGRDEQRQHAKGEMPQEEEESSERTVSSSTQKHDGATEGGEA